MNALQQREGETVKACHSAVRANKEDIEPELEPLDISDAYLDKLEISNNPLDDSATTSKLWYEKETRPNIVLPLELAQEDFRDMVEA